MLCSTCALALPCANAEKKGCTGTRWRVGSVLCSTCALALPCANAEQKGCIGTRWKQGYALCATCALAIPCEGKKCNRTRDREDQALCYECQGREKCRRCKLVYPEEKCSYCEECKPLCKEKGMECNEIVLANRRYCRGCKPKKTCTFPAGCFNEAQYRGSRCGKHRL